MTVIQILEKFPGKQPQWSPIFVQLQAFQFYYKAGLVHGSCLENFSNFSEQIFFM